jgi:hypothetical protein
MKPLSFARRFDNNACNHTIKKLLKTSSLDPLRPELAFNLLISRPEALTQDDRR